MKKFLVFALLIAGLLIWATKGFATVSPDPDNAAGIDAHSNTVKEGLAVAISDVTSGNTVQVGPYGGLYEGAVSVEQAAGVTNNTQITTGGGVLTGVNFVASNANDYIEFYDGTTRGNWTNCLLDLQHATANESAPPWKGAIEFTTGLSAYTSDGVAQVQYRKEDQGE